MRKIIISVLVTGLLLTTTIVNVNAVNDSFADIYVDDDNTQGPWDGTYEHPYQHIQDGVNNASFRDVVYVSSGTYSESVSIGRHLTLKGENRDTTIIKGDIYISDNYVNFLGFTIMQISTTDFYFVGIYILSDRSNIIIKDNLIIGNENIHKSHWSGIHLLGNNRNVIIQNNIILDGTGDFVAWGIALNSASHCVIKNNTIKNIKSNDMFSYGIQVTSSHNITIEDNFVEGTEAAWNLGDGIYMSQQSNYNAVHKNTLINNQFSGISLGDANWNNVSENIITGSRDGVYITLITQYNLNQNNEIYKNDISNNEVGIHLVGRADQNIISSNMIYDNDIGINIEGTTNNTIDGNIIYQNDYGVKVIKYHHLSDPEIVYPNYNIVTKNNINNNTLYGIYVGIDSYSNDFYYNNLKNNGGLILGGNAKDSGSNTWDDNNGMGNYWDDYIGFDLNHDGIGDTPHFIKPYICGNKDRYPLTGPWSDPYTSQSVAQTQTSSQSSQQSSISQQITTGSTAISGKTTIN